MKIFILISFFLMFPMMIQAAAVCAHSQEDAEHACSLHLSRKNCSCEETFSAAKQCFAYGKNSYHCSWD